MHPTWMSDTERGSAHAQSAPREIPRPTARPSRSPSSSSSRDGLLKSLFTLSPPNDATRVRNAASFGQMPFTGGEEEAHDSWHDKWEAHRRTSLDEQHRAAESSAVVSVLGGGPPSSAVRDVKRWNLYSAPEAAYHIAKAGASATWQPAAAAKASGSAPATASGATKPRSGYGEDIYRSTFWG